MMSNKYLKALYVAAQQAYHDEVVATDMEEFTIGEGNEYLDETDWIKNRVEYWINEAQREGTLPVKLYDVTILLPDKQHRFLVVFAFDDVLAREQIEEKFGKVNITYMEENQHRISGR